MKKNQQSPNPTGAKGKPFSLAPMSFDDAVRKILSASPAPKPGKNKTKKEPKRER